MVGRTPEYLGKKIQATEMKLVVLYLMFVPPLCSRFAGASRSCGRPEVVDPQPRPARPLEVVYAFTSAANNNGSAFGGLTGNTDWYNTTLGLAMLAGRFFLSCPSWRSPARWRASSPCPSGRHVPDRDAALRRAPHGVVLIVVGLTYFPVVSLGPILEQLGL